LGFSFLLRLGVAAIAQCTGYSPVDRSRPRFWDIFTVHPSDFPLPRFLFRHEIFIKTLKVGSCQPTTLKRNDPTPSEAIRLSTDTAGRDLSDKALRGATLILSCGLFDNILCDATLHPLCILNGLLTSNLCSDLLLLLCLTKRGKCGVVGVRGEDGQKFF